MYCLIIALVEFPVTSSWELCASLEDSEELCSMLLVISTQRACLGHSGGTDTAEKQVTPFRVTRLTLWRRGKQLPLACSEGSPHATVPRQRSWGRRGLADGSCILHLQYDHTS